MQTVDSHSHDFDRIPDTAATKDCITEDVLPIYSDVSDTIGPFVKVADGRIMSPTKKASLPLPRVFSRQARLAYSFNNLKSGTLISIGQLCNDDCKAIFSKYDVKIKKNNKLLIQGRQTDNGSWKLPLGNNHTSLQNPPTPLHNSHVANGVIQLDSTMGELA